MHTVFTRSSEKISRRNSQAALPLPNLKGLKESHPFIAALVERSWNGVGMSTFEIAEKVSAMDEMMNADLDPPRAVSAPTPTNSELRGTYDLRVGGEKEGDWGSVRMYGQTTPANDACMQSKSKQSKVA